MTKSDGIFFIQFQNAYNNMTKIEQIGIIVYFKIFRKKCVEHIDKKYM